MNLKNKILVASKNLKHSGWRQAVILIIKDENSSHLGFILNNCSPVSLKEAFATHPDKKECSSERPLMFGGPISSPPVCIHQCYRYFMDSSQQIVEGLYQTADIDNMIALMDEGEWHKVFAGYCGWGPGQLAQEMAHGHWHIADFDERYLLVDDVTEIWKMAIKNFGDSIYNKLKIKTSPKYSLN